MYNDVGKPLAVEGGDLQFRPGSERLGGPPVYLGTFDWKAFQFTANRFLPIPANLSAKFTLSRDGFTLEQGVSKRRPIATRCTSGNEGFREPEMEISLSRLGEPARPAPRFAFPGDAHRSHRRPRRSHLRRGRVQQQRQLFRSGYYADVSADTFTRRVSPAEAVFASTTRVWSFPTFWRKPSAAR